MMILKGKKINGVINKDLEKIKEKNQKTWGGFSEFRDFPIC